MDQGATERVAGTQAADHGDRGWWYDDSMFVCRGEHAIAAHLHDREIHAVLKQSVGGRVRIGCADCYVALRALPDGNGAVCEELRDAGTRRHGDGQNIGL